jgi:hypothetical protein
MITAGKLGLERLLGPAVERLLAIAAMVVVEAAIPAAAEPLAPVAVTGVFDLDLADVKRGPLEAAINGAKAQARCYPPRATFTLEVHEGSDPSFAKTLADFRKKELEKYLPSLGLEPGQFDPVAQVAFVPSYGGDPVRIDFDKYNKKDIDPPKFHTLKSQPPKGTSVSPDQRIEVKIEASERYEDGHKSWPTGVQSIQVRADDGVVEPTGFYRPPQPCEPRALNVTYTVPKVPPPVVHLCAIVEDGVGNRDQECADFPTGEWYGTLKGRGRGGPFNETAAVSFSFSEEPDGSIKGRGHVTMTTAKQVNFPTAGCVVQNMPPEPFDISINGRRAGDEFQLELENPRKSVVFSSTCPHASRTEARTTSAFLGPGVAHAFLRPRVAARDGATNQFNGKVGYVETNATIELHRAMQR